MKNSRLIGGKPKIGIRPIIDGRRGGIRESLEDMTMTMARKVAELYSSELYHSDGTPVECIIADTTIGGVANPIMVSTVHEQDYYEKNGSEYVLKGLSLAIVLDPRDEKNERLDTSLDESLVVDFGREAISKLYKYLQSKKDLKDIPANICVYYATNTNESDINGRYILKSYCDGSVGNIETLDYKNYMFTSTEATAADEDTASQFEIFKSNMKKAATEAVGVIGYGRYKNGQIQSMKINLKVNIKTYTELLYLISTAADELNTQFSGFDIKVLVSSQDQLEALIVKDKGEDAKSILLY